MVHPRLMCYYLFIYFLMMLEIEPELAGMPAGVDYVCFYTA